MIRLQSSHHGSCKMPFIYGLPTQMANLARSLVSCLLLRECCFPPWQLNMASRACVATEALSSVSFGLFDCCCHLLGLLRPLRWPLFLACGKSPGKWAVLKKKEAFFFLFFDCFPIRRKVPPRRHDLLMCDFSSCPPPSLSALLSEVPPRRHDLLMCDFSSCPPPSLSASLSGERCPPP